jgi:hypothetical protein
MGENVMMYTFIVDVRYDDCRFTSRAGNFLLLSGNRLVGIEVVPPPYLSRI